jgi:hypothetical protein
VVREALHTREYSRCLVILKVITRFYAFVCIVLKYTSVGRDIARSRCNVCSSMHNCFYFNVNQCLTMNALNNSDFPETRFCLLTNP